MTDVMIGMIIIATTTPAMKLDPTTASPSWSCRNGTTERWSARKCDDRREVASGATLSPQRPNSRLGSAASRSIAEVRIARTRAGRVLVDEQRHRDAERHREHHRDRGDDQRSLDQPEHAEVAEARVPHAGREEVPDAAGLERRPRLVDQEEQRRDDDDEAHRGRGGRETAEDPVARRRMELRRAGNVCGFHRCDGAVSDAHESSSRGSVERSRAASCPDAPHGRRAR